MKRTIKSIIKGILLKAHPFIRVALFRYNIRRKVTLKVISDRSVVAYTDHNSITISDENVFFQNEDLSLVDKYHVTNGLLAHETAHILYTTPRLKLDLVKSMQDKSLFTKFPDFFPKTWEALKAVDGFDSLSKDSKENLCYNVASEALSVQNITEDSYIEKAWIADFENKLTTSLKRLREIHSSETTFAELNSYCLSVDESKARLALMNAVTSAMLIFGKYGVYDKPKNGETWEFWNIFEDIKAQYVDAFTENKSLERSLKAFAVADELFEKFADIFVIGQQESLELEGVATLAKNVLENSDTTSLSKTAVHVIAELDERLKDDENHVGRNGNLNSEQIKQELLADESESESNHSEKGKISDDAGIPGGDAGEGVDEEDILTLEKLSKELKDFQEIGEDTFDGLREQKEKLEKQKVVDPVEHAPLLTGMHKDVKLIVSEQKKKVGFTLNDFLDAEENKSFKETYKKLEREIKKLIEKTNSPIEKRGSYSGSRLDRTGFIRKDKRYYNRVVRPKKRPSVCFSISIDASGSTHGEIMATQRLGVLLLSMVCDKLDIPFTVKLHRTNYYHDSDYVSEVKLDVVHSFNDKKVDYEKILSIESGGANRDGLAFAYHLKELESRKEEHKVFFIWSDGEPADTGYMGSEAVKDIQNIIAAHPKVDTVAFGIGQSAPQLQKIYNNQFYNCQNLDDLSKHIIEIVKKIFNIF
jgi:hypothetical protein